MSRQKKSLTNVRVNIFFFIISGILAFFSRKIFLNSLGDDFMGLTSTLGNMLTLMSMAEFGIGTAVVIALYRLVYEKKQSEIIEIVSVMGFLYQRVGVFILSVAIILSLFFPFFFKNSNISLVGIYSVFYTLLICAVSGYFINFKQIILNADQKNYVITAYANVSTLIKVLLQIVVVYFYSNFYLWLLIELVVTFTQYILLERKINKDYPWLKINKSEGKRLFKKYADLWIKVKQVFVQKISNLIISQTDQILIFTFTNLQTVAFFGNYSLIINKIAGLTDVMFVGITGSVGNLIAEGNIKNILKVFWELVSLRYFLTGALVCFMFFSVEPIISMWLGEKYIMDKTTLYLFLANFFVLQLRYPVDLFKDAYGLFQDTWAPTFESIANLIISVILGYYFGINGVLLGTLISAFLIKMIWKPYFLFEKGFNKSVFEYWKKISKYFVGLLLTFLIVNFVKRYFSFEGVEVIIRTILYCFLVFLSSCTVYLIFLIIIDQYFRSVCHRISSPVLVRVESFFKYFWKNI